MGRRVTAIGALLAIATAATVATASPSGAGDANGDKLDDLAIGVPGQVVGGDVDAGEVLVFPAGKPSGVKAFSSDTSGVVGAAEPEDGLGNSQAWGDFNGDGYDDLATAAPYEDVGTVDSAGAVTILKGTASGVTATGSRELTENSPGMAGTSEAGDYWGHGLATGDIDGDGYDDLVVAAGYEDVGSLDNAGAITIVYGSPTGLTTTGSVQKTKSSPGVPGEIHDSDYWSYDGVALGDVNRDGFDEIVVSDGYATVDGQLRAGALEVLRGSANGVSTAGSQMISENTAGVVGAAEENDYFSYASVGFGDFNDDGYAYLAVGV
jgi:hypothetical protein